MDFVFVVIPWVLAGLFWARAEALALRSNAEYELLKRALTKAGIDPYGK